MGLYDRYLAHRLRYSDADLPETVAIIVTERDLLEADGYRTLERVFDWTVEFGVTRIAVYVSVLDGEVVDTIRSEISHIDAPRELAVRGPADDEQADAPILVSIGLGGKYEFATAVRGLAEDVDAGELAPEDIDEAAIERELVFPVQQIGRASCRERV